MALVPYVNESITDQAFLVLLTFTDPETGAQTRVVNNNEDVTSRGQVYLAYPFTITLPSDVADQAPSARLTIDNVDREITRWVRRTLEPPEVKLEVVLSGAPDTPERTVDFLRLTGVTYDALSVSGTLEPHDFLNSPAIDSIYSAVEFPDLVYQ